MKFMHISDLHIGKQLYHYNMRAEQRDILHKMIHIAEDEQTDAILIAGDIYDKSVPSAEAVSVFDEFLTELHALNKEIFVIAGNHDSAERIDYAGEILARHRVHIAGMPPRNGSEHLHRTVLADEYGNVNIYLLPFVKPMYVRGVFPEKETVSYEEAVAGLLTREEIDTSERNILVAHQFFVSGTNEPKTGDTELLMLGGIDKVDISVLPDFDYAAFGHIHRTQRIGRDHYRYSGTPLAYSVKEADREKSVTIVEIKEKGSKPDIKQIPLEPLRKITVLRDTLVHVLEQAERYAEDYVYITLTDEDDPYKPKERLEEVYPYILGIQIDNSRTRQIMNTEGRILKDVDPFTVFERFFEEVQGRSMNEAEESLLSDMLNEALGTEEEG